MIDMTVVESTILVMKIIMIKTQPSHSTIISQLRIARLRIAGAPGHTPNGETRYYVQTYTHRFRDAIPRADGYCII